MCREDRSELCVALRTVSQVPDVAVDIERARSVPELGDIGSDTGGMETRSVSTHGKVTSEEVGEPLVELVALERADRLTEESGS